MKLTRISIDKMTFAAAESNVSGYGTGSAEHWKAEYRGVAQAQLEADQKVLDACEREAQEKVKEIFEELEANITSMYSRDVPDVFSYYNLQPHDLEALKQKHLNGED